MITLENFIKESSASTCYWISKDNPEELNVYVGATGDHLDYIKHQIHPRTFLEEDHSTCVGIAWNKTEILVGDSSVSNEMNFKAACISAFNRALTWPNRGDVLTVDLPGFYMMEVSLTKDSTPEELYKNQIAPLFKDAKPGPDGYQRAIVDLESNYILIGKKKNIVFWTPEEFDSEYDL